MNETSPPWLEPFPRRFVDSALKIKSWDDIEPYYVKLAEQTPSDPAALEKWILDWSELTCVVDESVTRRYIAMTCRTDDDEKKEAYLHCVREIQPKAAEWEHRLHGKYLESPHRAALDMERYGRLERIIKVSVELFDERNIPLQVKLSELSQQYQALIGGMTVEFEGQERTLPQVARFLLEPDRPLRERAFMAMTRRRLRDRDRLDGIFDEMLKLRNEWAGNLGLPDYRDYCFKSKLRDYTPGDIERFLDAIEKTAVPLARRITERRGRKMDLSSVCPWDTACDPEGRPPLKPFEKPSELFEGARRVFEKVDRRLSEMFGSIGFSMDLESRKGKAPGGYQATLEEARIPFIFTNAVGSHDDVSTLLHEGGHAFHTLMSRRQPVVWYRHASMEFSEVASMSMELIGGESLEPFYSGEESRKRAKRERLETIVAIFPWVATVDAFQSWVYTNPGHGREERKAAWVEITKRFNTGVDWSKTPEGALESLWHRQLHIFEVPFYFIEYAIAQLGALQVYRNYKEDPAGAASRLLSAFSLGGSKPPEELFEAAGIRMDFSAELLGELMDFVASELEV
ncbi:MAG: M3 family oligoendopeptidase [Candidatus Nitrospinota bacterium M3_3B_026]